MQFINLCFGRSTWGEKKADQSDRAEPRLCKDSVGSCWIWIRPQAGLLVS